MQEIHHAYNDFQILRVNYIDEVFHILDKLRARSHHQNDQKYNQNRMNVNMGSKKETEIIFYIENQILPVVDQHNNSGKGYRLLN